MGLLQKHVVVTGCNIEPSRTSGQLSAAQAHQATDTLCQPVFVALGLKLRR
jgi:hypothetical protein